MSVQRKLGARVREIRKRRGLTQARLAEKAGISTKYVGAIEGGGENPTVEILARLSAALGLRPADLLDFEHLEDMDLPALRGEIERMLGDLSGPPEAQRMLRVVRALLR